MGLVSVLVVCRNVYWFEHSFLGMTDSSVDGSEGESFDGSFGLIGDFHFILSADEFRERLDSADVIFFEYPDSELENTGFISSVKHGYAYGGFLMAIVYSILFVERKLFARSSLAYVLLHKYREKLFGVEGSEERAMYIQGNDDIGVVRFVIMMAVLVIAPRWVVRSFLEWVALKTSDKDSDDPVMAEDYHAMLSDDGERTEGMDERDEAMVENIESYLAEHPSVDDVVLVVGMAHTSSIIELLVENGIVESESIELLNDGVSSEFLFERGPYNRVENDFFEL